MMIQELHALEIALLKSMFSWLSLNVAGDLVVY